MAIRKMSSPDLRRVAGIHVACWQTAYAGILPDERLAGMTVDEQTEIWETTLFHRPARSNFVLEEVGTIEGWCGIGPCRDDDEDKRLTGEIYGLYVHPDSQGRGLGTALLTHAHGFFRDRGYRESVLWVLEENHLSRKFYEHRRYVLDRNSRMTAEWLGVPQVRYRRAL